MTCASRVELDFTNIEVGGVTLEVFGITDVGELSESEELIATYKSADRWLLGSTNMMVLTTRADVTASLPCQICVYPGPPPTSVHVGDCLDPFTVEDDTIEIPDSFSVRISGAAGGIDYLGDVPLGCFSGDDIDGECYTYYMSETTSVTYNMNGTFVLPTGTAAVLKSDCNTVFESDGWGIVNICRYFEKGKVGLTSPELDAGLVVMTRGAIPNREIRLGFYVLVWAWSAIAPAYDTFMYEYSGVSETWLESAYTKAVAEAFLVDGLLLSQCYNRVNDESWTTSGNYSEPSLSILATS